MSEKLLIKSGMEISDHTGRHVGMVDEVDSDRIKLIRNDGFNGAHHFIALDQVDKVAGDRVYLKHSVAIPVGVGA